MSADVAYGVVVIRTLTPILALKECTGTVICGKRSAANADGLAARFTRLGAHRGLGRSASYPA
jgi:hypothetical protein